MDDSVTQAELEAANAYDALFVPALFGQWAAGLVDAAGIGVGYRVLDVACGTGVLARAAQARTGATGYVAGLDPAPGMLAVARAHQPGIDWRVGVAEALPFEDCSFDAVLSQFGLMFFTDRRRALGEMLRVVSKGGQLVVAVWDALANMPAYAGEVALLERLAGTQAAEAVRAPFVLGEPAQLAALFDSVGADPVVVTTRHGTARFPSIRTMVEADLRGWLPMLGVLLSEAQIARILREAEDALDAYRDPDGSASFPVSAHVVQATKG